MNSRNIRISNLEDHRTICFGVVNSSETFQGGGFGEIESGRKRDTEITQGKLLVVGFRQDVEAIFSPGYVALSLNDEEREMLKNQEPSEFEDVPSTSDNTLESLNAQLDAARDYVRSMCAISPIMIDPDIDISDTALNILAEQQKLFDQAKKDLKLITGIEEYTFYGGIPVPTDATVYAGQKIEDGVPGPISDGIPQEVIDEIEVIRNAENETLTGQNWGKPDPDAVAEETDIEGKS